MTFGYRGLLHLAHYCIGISDPFKFVFILIDCKMAVLDILCNFSEVQYNSLAFIAGLKRATDEGSLPEIAQYSPYYLPLNAFTDSKGSNLYILFIIFTKYLVKGITFIAIKSK